MNPTDSDRLQSEDFSLDIQSYESTACRVDISPVPRPEYQNPFLPSLNTGEESQQGGTFHLEGNPQQFRVFFEGNQLAEFGSLKSSFPAWARDKSRAPEEWTSLIHEIEGSHSIFGLGEKTKYLEKSGGTYEMWNRDPSGLYTHNEDPLYTSIPFYIVRKDDDPFSYLGLYLHHSERSKFDVQNRLGRGKVGLGVAAPRISMFLLPATTLKEVVKQFTQLTGKPFMPPKWAIGYHQSNYGIPHDEEEARDMARKFRQKEIPCDALYFDIQHMDEHRVFSWDRDRFPDPKGLMEDLHEQNFKGVTIVDPGIKKEEGYSPYDTGRERDVFIKDSEGEDFVGSLWPGFSTFPDFLRSETRDWWAKYNNQQLDWGVDGIWNDMNEPAIFFSRKNLYEQARQIQQDIDKGKSFGSELKHHLIEMATTTPEGLQHRDDSGEYHPHEKVHNLYGYYEAKATTEGLKQHRPNKRPFILTRAGFSGIQKYAAKWTGDNSSTWEHMKLSVYMVLNLGLSGVPFSGPDIGGFEGDVEPELLTRWIQLGSLFPFCRNHSGLDTVPQQPWSFGEPYERINKEYISLRYRIMPYLYTLFYKAHRTGLPLFRPLFMEFPSDNEARSITDHFMVGDALLAAPVLERGASKKSLYLPEGKKGTLDWQDWWTGKSYESGYHHFDAPLEKLPLFIREDHGVPLTETVQHTEDLPDTLRLRYNLKQKARVPIYHDDGETKDFQEGDYFFGEFVIDAQEGEKHADVSLEAKHEGREPFWDNVVLE
ncbi:glycoside hydrolase family 31 protein [Candidatus Bipolaricaulota bacterium]|nr:glycoside hydrolase family 31 protein [Candidatus Bipolaricaulota bacterium]